MRKVTFILLVLLVAGSAFAVQFETTINEAAGYVDLTLMDTVQFVLNTGGTAYFTFAIRAGLPGAQWFGTHPEGLSYSFNEVPVSVTTGVHMPIGFSFGFVQAGDALLVDQGYWHIFQLGDTVILDAGTVRLPWNPSVSYLPSGDYEMFLVDDQLGTLYSDSPIISNEDTTWGSLKALFR